MLFSTSFNQVHIALLRYSGRMHRFVLRLAVASILLLGGVLPSLGHANTFTVVSPSGLEESEGNDATGRMGAPPLVRYQSVRLADEFFNTTGRITSYRWNEHAARRRFAPTNRGDK